MGYTSRAPVLGNLHDCMLSPVHLLLLLLVESSTRVLDFGFFVEDRIMFTSKVVVQSMLKGRTTVLYFFHLPLTLLLCSRLCTGIPDGSGHLAAWL